MAKVVVDIDVAKSYDAPPSVRYGHMSEQELDDAIAREFEECSKKKSWQDMKSDKY